MVLSRLIFIRKPGSRSALFIELLTIKAGKEVYKKVLSTG
jgi:hypothetical protein